MQESHFNAIADVPYQKYSLGVNFLPCFQLNENPQRSSVSQKYAFARKT